MDAIRKQKGLCNFRKNFVGVIMKDTNSNIHAKAHSLANIIYKAIVRYIKSKKSPDSVRNAKFNLDFNRVWRVNTRDKSCQIGEKQ